MKNNTLIIAGPCAAENRQQILTTAQELKKNKIKIMRASLWKPRTRPGFSGVGIAGLAWLLEAAELYNLTIATEVMLPEHVEQISDKIQKENLENTVNLILWLGSRNQNHLIQRAIVREIKSKLPQAKLMIKNQPWRDYQHWQGIIKHVLAEDFPKNNLLLCHRGFQPDQTNNQEKLRNKPDIPMMNRMRKEAQLPMIFDASHTAGNSKKVIETLSRLLDQGGKIDGYMVEVHPNTKTAKTDRQQQLNFQEFRKLLAEVRL